MAVGRCSVEWNRADGFWLLEAVVAVGVFAILTAGLAELVVQSSRAGLALRRDATALVAAVQKMEQIRGLTWTFRRSDGALHSDRVSDITRDPPSSSGRGLAVSPNGVLARDVPGYVDYLNAHGGWVDSGPPRPVGTAFVRRWSLRPLDRANDDVVVCDVVVMPVAYVDRSRGIAPGPTDPGVVWLTTIRTRR